MAIPRIQLSNSSGSVPILGFGTAADPPVSGETTKSAILTAIQCGYRHFDAATLYHTEEPLGEVIAEAVKDGLIPSRSDLFVTSKLWCSDAHKDAVVPALKTSLRKLKMDYVDLYLIHWPASSKPGVYEYPIKEEDFMAMDYESVWEGMEECKRLGLAKAIGVSNFSCKKLAYVLAFAEIPPAVNQVEVNPSWQQKELIQFCKSNEVLVTAYSPLGAIGTFYGSNEVMESTVLNQIASLRNKTVAQVLYYLTKARGLRANTKLVTTRNLVKTQVSLRWAVEQGNAVVVKSFNQKRMKQNLDIFDWELTSEDHEMIKTIPQSRVCRGIDYISRYGPFTTTAELWDEEV